MSRSSAKYHLFNRAGCLLGVYRCPEAAMTALDEIGMRFECAGEGSWIGYSDGGAQRYLIRRAR